MSNKYVFLFFQSFPNSILNYNWFDGFLVCPVTNAPPQTGGNTTGGNTTGGPGASTASTPRSRSS